MFSNIHVNEFCNGEMRTNGKSYIKQIGKKREFDSTKMANAFIFQHALEDANQFEQVLDAVIKWWERYIDNQKWLQAK